MKIKIAKNIEECAAWSGVGVVVDVLRSSATVCALIKNNKKNLRLFDDKAAAAQYYRANAGTEFISELPFEEDFKQIDNSPRLALKTNPQKSALIITTAGTKAVMSFKNASAVLMGGFCNFDAVLRFINTRGEDVLIAPSALFGFLDNVEDYLCADALANADNPDAATSAIKEIKLSPRFKDFLANGPATAKKDADICLTLNSLPVVPYIKIYENSARVYNAASLPRTFEGVDFDLPRHPLNAKNKKAVVLTSGGLDSTVCLYWAAREGYECTALSVSYGQKHEREVEAARAIAKSLKIKFEHIKLSLPWLKTSSLVGKGTLPSKEIKDIGKEIPSTYVPARNLLFVSLAASLADSIGAHAIVLGPNALDFSGYPDCRPEFYRPLGLAVQEGTVHQPEILTPIIKMSKAEIIKLGVRLGAPLEKTWSCYAGGKKPCGKCESCVLRAKGFKEAHAKDGAL